MQCVVCKESASTEQELKVENVRRLGLRKAGMTIAGLIHAWFVFYGRDCKRNISRVSQNQTLSSEKTNRSLLITHEVDVFFSADCFPVCYKQKSFFNQH